MSDKNVIDPAISQLLGDGPVVEVKTESMDDRMKSILSLKNESKIRYLIDLCNIGVWHLKGLQINHHAEASNFTFDLIPEESLNEMCKLATEYADKLNEFIESMFIKIMKKDEDPENDQKKS